MSKKVRKKRKKRRVRIRFFRVFILSCIMFSLVYFGIFFIRGGSKSDSDGANNRDEINFLLLGVDSKDVSENGNTRSDTMMLFNINKDTGRINILSIPRDTRTRIEGRKNQEKINHSYAYGGPELTLSTTSDLLGVDLEYYVVVDYQFVERFVDLIGGVEIEVPVDMQYEAPGDDPPLKIDLKAGNQVLDGDEALQFLRYRSYATADIGRIDAQQEFMKAMINQAIKPRNILRVPQMISAYNNNVETNIPFSALTKYGLKANKYDLDNINTVTLPGEPAMINGVSYYIHYEEQTRPLVQDLFNII